MLTAGGNARGRWSRDQAPPDPGHSPVSGLGMPQRPWSPSLDTLVLGVLLFARAAELLASAVEPERNVLARALIGGAFLLFLASLLAALAGHHPGHVPW